MQVRALQGDTVDLLVWRHLGSTSGGAVEATLQANPGLADLGPLLPEGTTVEIPSNTSSTTDTASTVSLWT